MTPTRRLGWGFAGGEKFSELTIVYKSGIEIMIIFITRHKVAIHRGYTQKKKNASLQVKIGHNANWRRSFFVSCLTRFEVKTAMSAFR